jgi:hypothetical protein
MQVVHQVVLMVEETEEMVVAITLVVTLDITQVAEAVVVDTTLSILDMVETLVVED